MLSDAGCVTLMMLIFSLGVGIIVVAILDACGVKENAREPISERKGTTETAKPADNFLQKLRDMPVR